MTAPPQKRRDPLAVLLLYTPLLGITIFGKFAVSVGDREILLGIPLIMGATLVGAVSGRLRPDRLRTPLFVLMAGWLMLQQVLTAPSFSPLSLLLLVCLHAAYAFALVGAGDDAEVHLSRFRDFALFICLLGVAQYLAQFVVTARYAFPIEHFTPDWLLAHHYNMLNPLRYGSMTYKSNGVFMAEPSYFSQLLAAGFVCEAAGPKRLWRLACFCAGFVVAYSGTGLLMMSAAIPVLIIVHRRYELLIVIACTALALFAFSGPLGLDLFLERALEFRNPNSSAYMRYVGGLYLFDQYLWSDPIRWLFGFGSGTMFHTTPVPMYNVAETGWVKIIVEFGLVGGGAYFAFLYTCVFRARQPLVQRVTLAVTTLLGGILDPGAHGFVLTLLVWLPAQVPSAAKNLTTRRRVAAPALVEATP